MKPLLANESRPVLEHFARPGTLLALDYDGTLAPIVDDPGQAHMGESTRELLRRAALRYPTVVITGRARVDVMRFLSGLPSLEIIGNHGLEGDGARTMHFLKRVTAWRTELGPVLQSLPGVQIEDKHYSLTVHYRACPDKAAARELIQAAVANLEGVRLIGGKDVVNLVPQEAATKGDALEAAMVRHACAKAVFVGDDDTDEDVFALRQSDRLLTVRVGMKEGSAADYYLDGQDDVNRLLQLLLEMNRVKDGQGRESTTWE